MKINISGIDELYSKLRTIDEKGVISSEILVKNGEKLAKLISEDAPVSTVHDKHGRDCIGKELKINGKTLKVVDVGLKKGMANAGDTWNIWKGLYFNHYGWKHNRSGKKITTNLLWFDKSVKKHRRKILNGITEELLKHVSKLF